MAGKAAPREREGQPIPARVEDVGEPIQTGPVRPLELPDQIKRLGPDTVPDPDVPSYVGFLPDETPNEDYTLAGAVRNLKP